MILVAKTVIMKDIFSMMNRLRGRNLAHPGCLIGVTAGLTLGIILAGVLAMANVSYLGVSLVWLGLTVGLGAIGWIVGSALSSRFPALEQTAESAEKTDVDADASAD